MDGLFEHVFCPKSLLLYESNEAQSFWCNTCFRCKWYILSRRIVSVNEHDI